MATSTDGITWSIAGATQTLFSITYGNNMFVAGGQYGTTLTSSDGSTWTNGVSRAHADPRGIVYGNNHFVAVSGGSLVVTSPDGINWTNSDSGSSNGLSSVTYGQNQFVAVGAGGTISTSPDGVTWTSRVSETTHELEHIAYGNNTFVAVGLYGTIVTSQDGVTWTNRALGTLYQLWGVGCGNDHFVAVGVGAIVQSGALVQPVALSVSAGNQTTNLVLSWPLTPDVYTLEASPNLSPGNWAPAGAPVQLVGDTYQATVQPGSPGQFFRLQRQ